MKCRACGNEMEIRQTETGKVAICHTCKVKRRLRKKENEDSAPQVYSNIPEEEIRAKSEREIRQNYQQMLDAGENDNIGRKSRKSDYKPRKQRRRKKKNTALKVILVLLLLAVLGVGAYFGYRYYRNNFAGTGQNNQTTGEEQNPATSNNSINVSTSDFSVEYLSHETSTDQSGNPCLLFYYIYTNNRKDISSNALSDVNLTAAQSGGECTESTLASPPEEVSNMTVDVEYNESITVCQVFSLSDTSEVTISVADLLAADGTVLGRQTFPL